MAGIWTTEKMSTETERERSDWAREREGSGCKRVKYTRIAVRKRLAATGTHVPYGITQYYLPPGRGDIPAFTPAG